MSTRRARGQKELPNAGSPANFLRAVPHVNQAMETHYLSDGSMVVSIPIRRPKYLVPPLSWVLPFSPFRRVQLEPVGSGVLGLCDGRRTVEAIIERFATDHKLSFREGQLAVTQFLRQLMQRGLVALVGQDKGPGRP
jgi:hypothetical protein